MSRYRWGLLAATLAMLLMLTGLFAVAADMVEFPADAAKLPPDAVASVPELDAFHEVIHAIWHDAWPQKDMALLRRLQPEVANGVSKIAAARLPGILEAKNDLWGQGIRNLRDVADEYSNATVGKDDERLLAAAENLHARFEFLMRAVRPPLPELGEFHAALYMLERHYLPEGQTEKIREIAAELQHRMSALNGVTLPERLQDIDDDFRVARDILSGSINSLISSAQADDMATVRAALESVKSCYQKLEGVFR